MFPFSSSEFCVWPPNSTSNGAYYVTFLYDGITCHMLEKTTTTGEWSMFPPGHSFTPLFLLISKLAVGLGLWGAPTPLLFPRILPILFVCYCEDPLKEFQSECENAVNSIVTISLNVLAKIAALELITCLTHGRSMSPLWCTVFRDVMPCVLVDRYQHFGGPVASTLVQKMDPPDNSETLLPIYWVIWCHISDDSQLHCICLQNLEFHIFQMWLWLHWAGDNCMNVYMYVCMYVCGAILFLFFCCMYFFRNSFEYSKN
jgi:hypothetical protein